MTKGRDWKHWFTPQFPGEEGYEGSPGRITVDSAHETVGGWLDRYFEFLKRLAVVALLGYAAQVSKSVWMDRLYLVSFILLAIWFTIPLSRAMTKLDDSIGPGRRGAYAWRLTSIALWICLSVLMYFSMEFVISAISKTHE